MSHTKPKSRRAPAQGLKQLSNPTGSSLELYFLEKMTTRFPLPLDKQLETSGRERSPIPALYSQATVALGVTNRALRYPTFPEGFVPGLSQFLELRWFRLGDPEDCELTRD